MSGGSTSGRLTLVCCAHVYGQLGGGGLLLGAGGADGLGRGGGEMNEAIMLIEIVGWAGPKWHALLLCHYFQSP